MSRRAFLLVQCFPAPPGITKEHGCGVNPLPRRGTHIPGLLSGSLNIARAPSKFLLTEARHHRVCERNNSARCGTTVKRQLGSPWPGLSIGRGPGIPRVATRSYDEMDWPRRARQRSEVPSQILGRVEVWRDPTRPEESHCGRPCRCHAGRQTGAANRVSAERPRPGSAGDSTCRSAHGGNVSRVCGQALRASCLGDGEIYGEY